MIWDKKMAVNGFSFFANLLRVLIYDESTRCHPSDRLVFINGSYGNCMAGSIMPWDVFFTHFYKQTTLYKELRYEYLTALRITV